MRFVRNIRYAKYCSAKNGKYNNGGFTVGQIIAFILSQFSFLMTIVALVFGFVAISKGGSRSKSDVFLGYLFFFAVGLSGLWGFFFHAFFPVMAARFIGWQSSPFQFEVAVANLGMGVVGVFGLYASKSYRIAGTIFVSCLLWGAAYGHVVQMIKANNFASGNAGLIFYNDVILPFILIIFLFMQTKRNKVM